MDLIAGTIVVDMTDADVEVVDTTTVDITIWIHAGTYIANQMIASV